MSTTVRIRQRIENGIDGWLRPFLAEARHEAPIVVRRGPNPHEVSIELPFRSRGDAETFLRGEELARAKAAQGTVLAVEVVLDASAQPDEGPTRSSTEHARAWRG